MEYIRNNTKHTKTEGTNNKSFEFENYLHIVQHNELINTTNFSPNLIGAVKLSNYIGIKK